MRKTLYIHIGHYKTGTTALQECLAANPAFLARHGLRYGETGRENDKHSVLAFALYRAAGVRSLMHGYDDPTPAADLWQAVFQELRDSPEPAMIISSEEFMRLGQVPAAARALGAIIANTPQIDIRLIAYLRAPMDHLQSWYNQLIKMGVKTPDFATALTQFIEPVHYDYALALRPWLELFGPKALILRPYGTGDRVGDRLFRDFFATLGIATGDLWPPQGLDLPQFDPNPRLDPRLAEIGRLMQNADIPPEVVQWTCMRAAQYFDTVAPQDTADRAADLDALQQRLLAGLAQVQDLAPDLAPDQGQSLHPDDLTRWQQATRSAFASMPPQADTQSQPLNQQQDQDQTGWLLAGFLLQELQVMRRNMRRENDAITARLRTLEEAQGLRPPGPKKQDSGTKQDPGP